MRDTVTVLMSTYNGEKYLRTQIDTILSQQDVDVFLTVRDDGSRDSTLSILEEYENRCPNVQVIRDGVNLGVGRSFMTLLQTSRESMYYAFADQDDIWHTDKLAAGVKALCEINGPALYCCNQNCVNGKGEFQFVRFEKEGMESNLIQSVFNNYFAGCTMIMNKALRDIIVSPNHFPDMNFFTVRIHDAWVACVAYATGVVIFDEHAHMDFRRHEEAYSDEYAPGKKVNKKDIYLRKFHRFKKRGTIKNSVKSTADNMLLFYDSYLRNQEKKDLQLISSYKKNLYNKMKLINSPVFHKYARGTKGTKVLKILLGYY